MAYQSEDKISKELADGVFKQAPFGVCMEWGIVAYGNIVALAGY